MMELGKEPDVIKNSLPSAQPMSTSSSASTSTEDLDLDKHTTSSAEQGDTDEFGPNLIRLRVTQQIRELQTVIRDKTTSRSDFTFYADRLIRLVVEEGLNQLPYHKRTVITPTGQSYEGLRYEEGNCGVSVMRSGEAMEHGLRDCCRSMRIGKMLIMRDEGMNEAKVFYAKFPPGIHERNVLLLYPIMSTGKSVVKALEVLSQHKVEGKKVIVLTLFVTPDSIRNVMSRFPSVKILTSEVHPSAPTHFGQRYFGTD